ncbi:acetolactate decarboxylase [Pendulispora rubella]|uniref:Alpha-acetolactate decarboxylase n=1 Tax=Pendulispora rubella TaxID=2741070 RepID=A0ABZ2LCP4_9BACT
MSLRFRAFRVSGAVGVVLSSCLFACSSSPSSTYSGQSEKVETSESMVTAATIENAESAQSNGERESRGHRHRGTLVQFGTLDQLNRGVLDGPATAKDVGRNGDFGVGTYNALDGEMMVLDGVVYRFTSDGVLRVAHRNDPVPFAAVTDFRPDSHYVVQSPLANYEALRTFVTNAVPDQNRMFAIKVHGSFASIKTRAPRRQSIPYPPLAEAVKTQVEFTNTNIRGTLVGFRLPTYLGTANATGYHFHFVSDNHRAGGHVLDVALDWATVEVEALDRLEMTAPIPEED